MSQMIPQFQIYFMVNNLKIWCISRYFHNYWDIVEHPFYSCVLLYLPQKNHYSRLVARIAC